MKKNFKFLFLISAVVLLLVLVFIIPNSNLGTNNVIAGLGSLGNSPFGGKIIMKPALILEEKKIQCETLLICGGNEGVFWEPTVDVSCGLGTFNLKPDLPKLKLTTASEGYCIPASASDKTRRIPSIAINRWILGLYSSSTPTQIGICTCTNGVGPASEVTVSPVIINLTQVTMFGTSPW